MKTIDSRRRHIAAGLALAPLATSLSVFGQAAMPKTLTLLVPRTLVDPMMWWLVPLRPACLGFLVDRTLL